MMHDGTQKPLLGYVVAALAVAAALLARILLDPLLGDHLPFVTFFVAVAVANWFGGLRPGLVSTGLGLLLAWYFFVPTRLSFLGLTGPHLVGLVAYLMVCLAITAFGEAMRVTQRRAHRDQQAAREQREWFRTTLASIGDAVITTDADGNVTLANGVAQELTGWTQDEVAGQPLGVVFNVIDERTRQPIENPVQHVLREGRVVRLEDYTILVRRDGTERPVDDSAALIKDAAGQTTGVVLIFRDVSERRRLERESAERAAAARLLASVVESSGDAIVSMSLDGTIQTWNAAAGRLFGYTPQQAVGRHITLIIPPDRVGEEDRMIARVRAGDRVEHFDTVRLASNGRRIPVSLTVSPVRDEAGQVVGASKIARDITEREQAEQALRESEARFRTLADSAPVLIWVNGAAGCEYVNRSYLEFLGLTMEQVHGMNWAEYLHPEDVEGYVADYLRAFGERSLFEAQFRFRRADGQFRWLKSVGVPRFTPDGAFLGYIGSSIDITEIKQSEEALREAGRRKDEFIALFAHELRNPLAPIQTAAQLLGARPEPAILEQARQIIDRQVRQLVHIVDDLLEMSRLARGKVSLREERLDLAQLAQTAASDMLPAFETAGIRLQVSTPGTPTWVLGDHTRLTQVVSNLLANAQKFTKAGGEVGVIVAAETGRAVLTVRDTGTGIPADLLPRLFEPFAQADQGLARSAGGLGLGLAIVKRLVDLHHGSVAAESGGPGMGAAFTVRLPRVEEPQALTQTSASVDGPLVRARRALRVLVIEDNRDAADSLRMLLEFCGCAVEVAYTGPDGLRAAGTGRPDLIFCDIGLPGMSGYEIARRIRAAAERESPVLVALTGYGRDEDREEAKAAGFDRHYVKPLEPAALERLLTEVH